MSVLPYVVDGEPVNAAETNAALRQVLTDSGLDPDDDFPGFMTEADVDASVAAEAALRIAGDATEAAARAAAVSAEAATRAAADSAEATARAAADTAEATTRAADDATEAAARIAGDATNATAITNEATARASADTVIAGNLTAEIANRAADVDAEEAARIAAVSAEATARAAADSAEATARAAADALKQDILARTTVAVTTASIADNAEETGTIALGKLGLIIKAVASGFCRVRLYSTNAARTADSGRAIGTDPDTAAGVLADLVFNSTSGLTINCQPLIPFNNNDSTVVTTIYYAIQNRSGGASATTVTFTRMVLES